MKIIHIFITLLFINFQVYSYSIQNTNTTQNKNIENKNETKTFQCSQGCLTNCISNNTCLQCKYEYENDNSCYKCKKTDTKTSEVYLNENGKCVKNTNILQKSKWLPSIDLVEISNGETIELSINEKSYLDYGPCVYINQFHRLGIWIKINITSFPMNGYVLMNIKRLNIDNITDESLFPELMIDTTSSHENETTPFCYTRGIMKGIESHMSFPVTEMLNNYVYIYFSMKGMGRIDFEVSLTDHGVEKKLKRFDVSKDMTNEMFYNPSISFSYTFDLTSESHYVYYDCIKTGKIKAALIMIEMGGNYIFNIDSTQDKKNLLLLEVDKTPNHNCIQTWSRKPYGYDEMKRDQGIYVFFNATNVTEQRLFLIGTPLHLYNPTITFRVICPDHCHQNDRNGYCSKSEGKCICYDGFGGSDCHKKCWYNNQWQESNNKELCYFGSNHCDEYCHCEKGYLLVDHYCISQECHKSELKKNSSDECLSTNKHCLPNCQCEKGYVKTDTFECLHHLCGNGILDEPEQCDNVSNCNSHCLCIDGFKPLPNKNECIEIITPWYFYFIIAIVCFIFIVTVIILLVNTTLFISKRRHKSDIKHLSEQQPIYYYNITNSKHEHSIQNRKLLKFQLHPHHLDFGNATIPTTVFETRFQDVHIKNHSKKKWMMIIFHTPNNPKYVVNFSPQVAFLSPMKKKLTVKIYLTLFCTTKIRNTKIPYTVWFSSSKNVLLEISDLLKDKTKTQWKQNHENELNALMEQVPYKYHGEFIIKTDSESSLSLDLDEIKMAEEPYQKASHVETYLGMYKSVVVSIKKYCHDYYSSDKWIVLKKELLRSVEEMEMLRNPCIVGCMGSVNYTTDFFVVSVYFELGSLNEFIPYNNHFYLSLQSKQIKNEKDERIQTQKVKKNKSNQKIEISVTNEIHVNKESKDNQEQFDIETISNEPTPQLKTKYLKRDSKRKTVIEVKTSNKNEMTSNRNDDISNNSTIQSNNNSNNNSFNSSMNQSLQSQHMFNNQNPYNKKTTPSLFVPIVSQNKSYTKSFQTLKSTKTGRIPIEIMKLPFKLKIKMLLDVSKGLLFLHLYDILHLNLKPSNVLINSLFEDSAICVKITDYSSSVELHHIKQSFHSNLSSYISPEYFDEKISKQCDVYSFGILAWELFYQTNIFHTQLTSDELKTIITQHQMPEFTDDIPSVVSRLISNCWNVNPDERPSFDSIVKTLNSIYNDSDRYAYLDEGVDRRLIANYITLKQQQLISDQSIIQQ